MDVIVAVPAYNCAPQVGRVLDGISSDLAARVREIWVIDNRSPDDTVQVALERQRSGRLPNLRVFRTRENNSLGGTHKVAFSRAAAAGATHVAILHGDDQATPAELALLMDHAASHPETSTVLGSRFDRRSRLVGYERKRVLGNKVLGALYSALALRRLQDLGSGLNLFAVRDLDPATYLGFADHLTFNFELLLDLVRRRVRFAYVPITWREEDQTSNARNANVFLTGLVGLLRWRVGLDRPTAAPGRTYEMDEVH